MERRTFLTGAAALTGVAAAPGLAASQAVAASSGPTGPPWSRVVRPGVEVLARSGYRQVRGQRVGLISNPTGIMPDLGHAVDAMVASGQIDLVAAFGPEHGFRGAAQAGDSGGSYVDERTGIRVYDTYGKSAAEIAAAYREADVETVMFDIQDVGARFYTYIWTMYDSMVAASRAGVRFVVLDRPNPVSATEAYGPVLHPEFATFVGLKPISQQHGMTVGELAQLFNAEFLPHDEEASGGSVDLDVVRMQGWSRDMFYEHTGLPWVMPSPNMPTVDTASVYPGTCLFEGTTMSEGRGTTRPFELVGAPYADWHWSAELTAQDIPGAGFREAYYTPTFSKHSGDLCSGLQVYVLDRERFEPIRTAIAMLITAKTLYGDFAWRYDSWDDEHPYWIDKLTGSEWVRTAIDSGKDVDAVVAGWQDELAGFRRTREKHLLYDERRGGPPWTR